MIINKNSILFALVLSLFVAITFSSTAMAGEKEGWLKFNPGLEKAAKEDKAILVDFYTDWCHWCKVMDEKTFGDEKVAAKLKERFVTIKLNAEDGSENVTYDNQTFTNPQFSQSFGVTGYPALGFLDSKGKPITLIPGYVPAEQFIHILDYIDQKCYEKDVSFDDFVKNGGCKEKKS